ncbi:uncharacterized protein LOC112467224 [Temnothorax curvispinosus]|uniref:Uncharacterized protein LOC112467224 n=1 Tax=Temnothorax curvispinosus TaxID=300111 RepID=A0A6J1RB88_9HYME|nr:uncharacterized protein LOC112467224 [Temnothorax curvispinosus]
MAYHTVSYEAATLLARVPPLHLYAEFLRRSYFRHRRMKENGNYNEVLAAAVRLEEWNALREQWRIHVTRANLPGRRTREAIGPSFEDWLDRSSGFLTYRLTQFLTGHGCFGTYLYRINKEDTPICRYCNTEEDTPEHTLKVCHFWAQERGELAAAIGQNLSLGNIVARICNSKERWNAFSTFAERVFQRKEEDERRRQQQMILDPG